MKMHLEKSDFLEQTASVAYVRYLLDNSGSLVVLIAVLHTDFQKRSITYLEDLASSCWDAALY